MVISHLVSAASLILHNDTCQIILYVIRPIDSEKLMWLSNNLSAASTLSHHYQ